MKSYKLVDNVDKLVYNYFCLKMDKLGCWIPLGVMYKLHGDNVDR